MGTNTHHYFDTFEEAEGYCLAGSTRPTIAYVVWSSRMESDKSPQKILDFLKEPEREETKQ
jgi:hypothetical protein